MTVAYPGGSGRNGHDQASRCSDIRAILVVTLDSDWSGSPGATVMREPGRTAHRTARS